MQKLGFGIVGTGFIAGAVADSIASASAATLVAVSSRRQDTADAFVADRDGVAGVEGLDALLARDDVAAVFIATPTAAKEAITLAAIAAGKHVLVDKPLPGRAAVERMTAAANASGVVFMDGTHFVHHPRTHAIKAALPEKLGRPKSLHTAFYFPFDDKTNIRFDPAQEPMGVVGDMGWYAMRAIVEYLDPPGVVTSVATVAERDPATETVVRVSGLLGFSSGESATFDIGYTTNTGIMDLSLIGANGMLSLDDFVLDWTNSFAFKNDDVATGYVYRSDMATRKDFAFVETPSDTAGDVLMIEHLAALAQSDDDAARGSYREAALRTQTYLDAVWASVVD
ncbi:MAG: Gfo/Idh/MocA family oxidoreductase [Gammaproteobacteria bacterium]|nr:Gfo/Idh/MocA family oxidoreductase [Gammaproteobacteria bacterium]